MTSPPPPEAVSGEHASSDPPRTSLLSAIEGGVVLKKASVKNAIKIANRLIKGHGRILVRKSGTEPKIRIMGESKNKALLKKCIKTVTRTIN